MCLRLAARCSIPTRPIPRFQFVIAVGFALVATQAPAEIAAATDSPVAATLRNDAELASVFFVDRTNGWAVGDRGVIWHTSDGGNAWQQQTSGVACRLNAVFFIDREHGWAVGGESRPYSQATQGVILCTENGGVTWTTAPGLILPLLTGVKFFNQKSGAAFGNGSPWQPSGVFVTQDAGASWQALPADQSSAWLAGDFIDMDTGALAGAAGQFATVARRQVVHSPLALSALRSFHAMRLAAPTAGWIVGDGGLVMTTNDLGRSWQSPSTEISDIPSNRFDFYALAIHQQNVWIAGSPGTRVFHSPDGGQSWQSYDTGHAIPIRSMHFVDDVRGWAVGDLGSILATSDGGRTWQVQRAGGRRASLLAVCAQPTEVPLEMIADYGAAQGYITTVDILHGRHSDAANDGVQSEQRAREAMLLAGAAAAEMAWRFPLPAADIGLSQQELLVALNRVNDGRAVDEIGRHVVMQLRIWRPDVVITPIAEQGAGQPGAILTQQMIERCVAAAADPTQFEEVGTTIGLQPWQVKKVYGVLPAGQRGDESLDATRYSIWLGCAPADFVAPARRILFSTSVAVASTTELKLLATGVGNSNGPASLFRGIALAPGTEARRAAPQPTENDVEMERRLAARQHRLRELLARSEGNAAWASQIDSLVADLDPNAGAELLFQLAGRYRQSAQLDLAADTYYLLSRRYPTHALADPALIWLVQYYASSETAHRSGRKPSNLRQVELASGDGGRFEPGADSAISPSGNEGIQQASATLGATDGSPTVGLSRNDRLRRAVQLVEYFKSARPQLYAEPAVRFAEVAAQRQLGYANAAKRYFISLGQLPENNPWRRCAATEDWLSKPGDTPPTKPLATCRRTATRPHLDGQLDEACWKTADELRFHSDQPEVNRTIASTVEEGAEEATVGKSANRQPSAGSVRLVYDNEFLYVGVTCPKVLTNASQKDARPRARDADLVLHDRVILRLDLDRDFSTAFELAVDDRGWSNDTCWEDAAWNPTWYIAAGESDTSWTAEAAIPLAELADEPPTSRHVWAVAARRIIPRTGYAAWAGDPAEPNSPDQFGLLIFE